MKQTDLSFIFLLAFGISLQAQNPFSKYKYKVETATLTNGKFDENHDKDKIVEMDDLVFNTQTGKITGKIRNEETGDNGSPGTSRFISMDPHAERYYHISPYAYCMNNPLKYIDPDGRDVYISYFEDGKEKEKMLYTPGMEYTGKNDFFKNAVSVLNKVNSVSGGNEILSALSNSEGKYLYSNASVPEGSGAATIPMENLGVYFVMGNNQSIADTAHELFHGYQIDKGVGGRSVVNEVDAYLFGNSVAYNYALNNFSDPESQKILFNHNKSVGQKNMAGRAYNEAYQNLINGSSGFSSTLDYNQAVRTFHRGASANRYGLYNAYPITTNNKNKGLIFQFMPLIH